MPLYFSLRIEVIVKIRGQFHIENDHAIILFKLQRQKADDQEGVIELQKLDGGVVVPKVSYVIVIHVFIQSGRNVMG